MKHLLIAGGLAAFLLIPAASAFAASPGTQGQPSQSCQSFFSGALTPTGFNQGGFVQATTLYAGAQPQNSQNPKSVSQYDVACFQAASR